jgi:hypothetical protein
VQLVPSSMLSVLQRELKLAPTLVGRGRFGCALAKRGQDVEKNHGTGHRKLARAARVEVALGAWRVENSGRWKCRPSGRGDRLAASEKRS